MITIIFLIIAGIAKAFMDLSSIDIFKNIKFNKSKSWVNKWKIPLIENKKSKWYYLGLHTPNYIEKFPFSSTMFSFLTDMWHFSQFVFLTCIFSAMVFYTPIFILTNVWLTLLCNLIILKTILTIIFQLFYSFIKKKNN